MDVRARDVAGRQGVSVSQTQKVDTVAPAGGPVGQTTVLTLPAIGLPNPVALKYTATNELAGQVRVRSSSATCWASSCAGSTPAG